MPWNKPSSEVPMHVAKNVRTLPLATLVTRLFTFCITLILSTGTPVFADSVNYFYDDLGRLSRVVKGSAGAVYQYDELGNILSVFNASTGGSSPVITGIIPNVLLVGTTMIVNISGSNLLTTDTVSANGGLVSIDNVTATDTLVRAEMTAHSAGSETIRVTTRNGTPNYAQTGVSLTASTLTFSPSQLALVPGGTGTLTASISPPLAGPLVINLQSSNTAVATVPQSVTVPTGGSLSFTVTALQTGSTTVSSGGLGSVVFVESPFTGDVSSLAANRVSVQFDSPQGNSVKAANAVSVAIDVSMDNAITAANPVSVVIQ
jgi:hypothetical protein